MNFLTSFFFNIMCFFLFYSFDLNSKKPCHYFKLGKGECPFDSRCFYRHALPDGKVVTNNIVKRRRRENAEGDRIVDDENLLWDYISRRERDGESDYSLEDDLYMFLLETFQDDDDDDNNSSFIRFALRENLILSDTDSDSDDSYDY